MSHTRFAVWPSCTGRSPGNTLPKGNVGMVLRRVEVVLKLCRDLITLLIFSELRQR